MTSKRIIFTGQSGIKIDGILKDFINKHSSFVRGRQKPLILKIEGEMKNIYLKEHNDAADSATLWMRNILMLPAPTLYNLWEKAFESVLKTIENGENKNKDIFINLHACFYHHTTVEYLSPAKIELLKKFNPDLFITLIDDIYDIHNRLRYPNQIFCGLYGGASDPVGAIFELMRILDWRAKEIMMTKYFAHELGVPNYVFAVKHSYDTLYKLIFEDKHTFYISHPISEVRRLQKIGENEKANQMIEEIRMLGVKFSSEFVSFLPTTIDELRIQHRNNKKKERIPKLMPRWDSEKYLNPTDLLFTPPRKRNEFDPIWEEEHKNSKELCLLLEELYKLIEVQVSSRDHKLVEQSRFLFVYRPCFNGNISGGVWKEIQYFRMLTNSEIDKKCFIYMPTEDQNKLKIRQFEKILESEIRNGTITCKDEKLITLDPEEENKLIAADNNINILTDIFKEIMDNKSIRCSGIERRGLEEDSSQKAISFIENITEQYVAIFNQYINQYKQDKTVLWEENNQSPGTLVDKIIKYLKNK
ncbi:MAG: hypothetical protein CVT89_01680 [Candidatus Altiarchaeales archaeon HGW-Altiarchaeales-2]|nr:MAG: hypothetical protein CVT89_01680 [Candidatus Altiarchaeales archaeon HGW-Altiarchaeales-2]